MGSKVKQIWRWGGVLMGFVWGVRARSREQSQKEVHSLVDMVSVSVGKVLLQ